MKPATTTKRTKPIPPRPAHLIAFGCLAALASACVDSADPPSGPVDLYAGYPTQEFRHEFSDGRVLSGTGVRIGDELLVDGDMILPATDDKTDVANAAVIYSLWPTRKIPYTFDPALDAVTRNKVISAMGPWTAMGFQFVPRGNQLSYVTITTGPSYTYPWACAATVGYQANNYYRAGAGCRTRDYVHEWGHVLGLLHEHERLDRDNYISISPGSNLNATIAGRGFNFGPYDFASIMHYDAFARNYDGSLGAQEIWPLDGRSPWSFGWNSTPSAGDQSALLTLYGTGPL
jgi:Astacin (Peptidase family M12A)